MSRPVARLDELVQGVCKIHGPQMGRVIQASSDVYANGKGVARRGDLVEAECGHRGLIITGKTDVKTNGKATARRFDLVGGYQKTDGSAPQLDVNSQDPLPYRGVIIGGSPDTFV